MAECEWCGEETAPGDLTSQEIRGAFHLFCSQQHAHNYSEQGADAAPRTIYDKVMKDEVVDEEEASQAAKILATHKHETSVPAQKPAPRRTRKPKASPT